MTGPTPPGSWAESRFPRCGSGKNFDSTAFNAWFTANVAGNASAEAVAQRRFRPAFKVAFDAWTATQPFTNSSAPPGPTYMPEYRLPQLAQAAALDKNASIQYTLGVEAGGNSDNYVRDTIYLATILFLSGSVATSDSSG